MVRPIIAAFVLMITLGIDSGNAQQAVSFKNFASFKQLVPGIDFYASNRQAVTPYEKPAAEAIARLRALFGPNLPKGAIFICSTLAQKDSIYEPKILKSGYSWTLTTITPEVRMQEMIARIKSQMGGELPAEIMARIKNRPQGMMGDAQSQMIGSTIQQVAYAILQTMLAKDLQFRSSRLDDMDKSPLPDWLDIGIATYASGSNPNLTFLQQHMDQTFPIEDILSMSRPFVASSIEGEGSNRGGGSGSRSTGGGPGGSGGTQGMPQGGFGGGGNNSGMQGMPQGGFGGSGNNGGMQRMPQGASGGRGQGGFGPNGGQRGGMQRNLPKDEQDRMLFDGQSSTFFAFVLEKVGVERIRTLIREVQEGKESREFITQPDVFGPDFGKTEESWAGWVKTLKPEAGGINPQTTR